MARGDPTKLFGELMKLNLSLSGLSVAVVANALIAALVGERVLSPEQAARVLERMADTIESAEPDLPAAPPAPQDLAALLQGQADTLRTVAKSLRPTTS